MSELPKGQIQIDSLSLTSVRFERLLPPGGKMKPMAVDLDFRVSVTSATPTAIVVQATILLFKEVEDAPFEMELTFDLAASVESAEDAKLLREFGKANAVGVLVPYMREAIASLTMRSGFPALVIPPVNVQSLLEIAAAGERKER